jgi:uncharacterized membrane protein YccC
VEYLQKAFRWTSLPRLKPEMTATLQLAIKTGIAALVTYLSAVGLSLPSPIWAVVSAVIVMQANLGSSYNAAWQRLVGTAIGALVGAVIASFGAPLAFTLGLGMTAVILICSLLKLSESLRIATVTFTIVLLADSSNHWLLGLERFVDVIFGILVALLVTITLWRPRARRDLRFSIAAILGDYAQLYEAIVTSYLTGQKDEQIFRGTPQRIKVTLIKAQTLLEDARREPPTRIDPFLAELLLFSERIQTDLFALEAVIQGSDQDSLQKHLETPIQNLSVSTLEALRALQNGLQLRQAPEALNVLTEAVEELDTEFTILRCSGTLRIYGIEETLRFSSFLFGMKALAEELQNLSASLSEMYGQG